MEQIQTITLRALENDKHFSLMDSGIRLFTAIEIDNEPFQAYLKAWQEAFQAEDEVMYLLHKSLELENAQIQHDLRCNCLTALLVSSDTMPAAHCRNRTRRPNDFMLT